MLSNFHKKESPIQGITGFGGGITRLGFSAGGPYSGHVFVAPFSGNIRAVEFDEIGGFGSQTTPTTAYTPRGVAAHPSGNYVAAGGISSPYTRAYPFTNGSFGNPTSVPFGVINSAYKINWNPTGTALLVGHFQSPNATIFPFSNGVFGTKYTDPSTAIGADAQSCAWHPSGNYVAVGTGSPPYMKVYSVSGSAWGTKSTDPTSPPTSLVRYIEFSPDGNYLALTYNDQLIVYEFSNGVFGTKYSATFPGNCYGFAWSPDGTYIVGGAVAYPYMRAWEFSSSGFGNSSVPSPLPPITGSPQAVYSVKFTPTGNSIILGTSGEMIAYEWSTSGWGSQIDSYSTGQIQDMSLTP